MLKWILYIWGSVKWKKFEGMEKKELSEEEKADEFSKKGEDAFTENNYLNAISFFDKAIKLEYQNPKSWLYKGASLYAMGKYIEAIKDIDKAIEIASNIDPTWNGFDLSWSYKGWISLALYRFEEAIEYHNKAIELNGINAIEDRKFTLIQWLKKLYIEKKHDEIETIVVKYSFNVLDLLTELNSTNKSEKETIEGIAKIAFGEDPFFSQTVKNDDPEIDTYKNIYLQSLKIISLLHIKNDDYFPVAHYTQKSTAELLLQKDKEGNVSKFRLSTIVTANDPREGKPLLQYLGIDERHASDYSQAFVGCFIFNADCLNQFRLYGKENGKEATGVSLVMKANFFNTDLSINKGLINPSNEELNKKGKIKKRKEVKKEQPMERESLFRCIYIDPFTGQAISIGHKDSYTFYRDKLRESNRNELKKDEIDKIEKEITKYEKNIKKILDAVKVNLNELKKLTDNDNLDATIICELLTHLRYLVKHVAFKEEQECRVIKVEKLKDSKNIKVNEDKSRMYIDYRTIDQYVKEIFFAPKAKGMALFQDLLRREGLDIKCHQSDHPFF